MNKITTYIISVFFILLLISKGIVSVGYMALSHWNETNIMELLTENESEEQKKGNSKAVESTVNEELFDHFSLHTIIVPENTSGSRIRLFTSTNLPDICLDVHTPPPDGLTFS